MSFLSFSKVLGDTLILRWQLRNLSSAEGYLRVPGSPQAPHNTLIGED